MSSGFRKDTTLENTVDFSQFFQEEGHHFTTSSNESVSHLELPSISQYVYTITGTLPNVKHLLEHAVDAFALDLAVHCNDLAIDG